MWRVGDRRAEGHKGGRPKKADNQKGRSNMSRWSYERKPNAGRVKRDEIQNSRTKRADFIHSWRSTVTGSDINHHNQSTLTLGSANILCVHCEGFVYSN